MKKAELVLQIKIDGQIKGGKNNMIVLQNGLHIPSRQFKEWRDNAVLQISLQPQQTFSNPHLFWIFEYTPSDRRRRDVSALLDAVFHCLEKSAVVSDDSIIQNMIFFHHQPDKENAGIIIYAYEIDSLETLMNAMFEALFEVVK